MVRTRGQQRREQLQEKEADDRRQREQRLHPNMMDLLQGYETGGGFRGRKAYVQQNYLNQQVNSFSAAPLPEVDKFGIDKIFCSVWLDNESVLVGTKCNKMISINTSTATAHIQSYPEPPIHRLGPDLLARSSHNCGQHALAVSPNRQLLLTGGAEPEDIVIWQLGGTHPVSGLPVMRPVQTLMGHADWVFGFAWLSEGHFVSAGRDMTIKLWQVPQAAQAAAQQGGVAQYLEESGAASLSLRYHKDKVRAIAYEADVEQVVALCIDGSISWWSPDLRLRGCWALPADCEDPTCLQVCGSTVAVGNINGVALMDTRMAAATANIKLSSKKRRVGPPPSASAHARAAAAVARSMAILYPTHQPGRRDGAAAAPPSTQTQQNQLQQQQQHDESDDSDSDSEDEEEAEQQQGPAVQQQGQQQRQQHPSMVDRDDGLNYIRERARTDVIERRRRAAALRAMGVAPVREKRLRPASIADGPFGPGGDGDAAVEAELVGQLFKDGDCGVRSLSLQRHLLTMGTGDGHLCFHDTRSMSSSSSAVPAAPTSSSGSSSLLSVLDAAVQGSCWSQDSWGRLPPRVGSVGMPVVRAHVNPALTRAGYHLMGTAYTAAYSHCWDPTGSRVFIGGGALQLGFRGASAALWQ